MKNIDSVSGLAVIAGLLIWQGLIKVKTVSSLSSILNRLSANLIRTGINPEPALYVRNNFQEGNDENFTPGYNRHHRRAVRIINTGAA